MRTSVRSRPDLRRATAADVPAIHAVMVAAGEALPEPDIYVVDDEAFVARHIDAEGFTLVACRDGAVVGAQIVRLPGEAEDNLGRDLGRPGIDLERVAHLESIAVLPEHQGHGLGRELIADAEARLARRGFRWAMCTVHPDNARSLRNLQDLGYRVMVTKEKYGGLRRHVMAKELRRAGAGRGRGEPWNVRCI